MHYTYSPEFFWTKQVELSDLHLRGSDTIRQKTGQKDKERSLVFILTHCTGLEERPKPSVWKKECAAAPHFHDNQLGPAPAVMLDQILNL